MALGVPILKHFRVFDVYREDSDQTLLMYRQILDITLWVYVCIIVLRSQ